MKKQLFLLFFSLLALVSQARTVTGTVIQASDGEPVTGASVAVKGVPGGAVTDIDGHYTINVPDGKDVLAFSFVGMKPLEVRIGGRSVVDVAMEENSEVLSEVVVTAMGQSQEKSRLNFAATTSLPDRAPTSSTPFRARLPVFRYLPPAAPPTRLRRSLSAPSPRLTPARATNLCSLSTACPSAAAVRRWPTSTPPTSKA